MICYFNFFPNKYILVIYVHVSVVSLVVLLTLCLTIYCCISHWREHQGIIYTVQWYCVNLESLLYLLINKVENCFLAWNKLVVELQKSSPPDVYINIL